MYTQIVILRELRTQVYNFILRTYGISKPAVKVVANSYLELEWCFRTSSLAFSSPLFPIYLFIALFRIISSAFENTKNKRRQKLYIISTPALLSL